MSRIADWFLYAVNDLKTAKAALAAEVNNTTCFHAHQVAEKCLKALLLDKEQEIPKTHDLLFLFERTIQYYLNLSHLKGALQFLNQFYIPMRYPDALPGGVAEGMPTNEEAKKAIDYAEEIFNFAQSCLRVEKGE